MAGLPSGPPFLVHSDYTDREMNLFKHQNLSDFQTQYSRNPTPQHSIVLKVC
jgi:hypothetical protein